MRVTVRGDGHTDDCILDTRGDTGPYMLYVRNWGSVYKPYDVRVQ